MNRLGISSRAVRRLRRRLAAEGGFGLIEVVVSAALLAVATLGLMAGIDGPALIAAKNQQRSIATSVAQQDQDRMRGMRAVDLSDYAPPVRSVNVGGVNYSVTSRAAWTSDASGTSSCASNSALAQYIDITSSVDWPANRGKPVVVESLVAPPNGAYNLIVQLQDQAGAAVTGLPVSVTGPANGTRSTNALGCAYFGNVPTGSYTATYGQIGWVDPGGNSNITLNGITVSKGGTASVQRQYAQAASIAVSFDTVKSGSSTPLAATAKSITATNSLIPTPPKVRAYSVSSAQSTIQATALFPFTAANGGYNVYAGTCADSDPSLPANQGPNYFNTNAGHVVPPAGGSSSVTIRTPAINTSVIRSGGSALSGAHVIVKPTSSTCADSYPATSTTATGALAQPAYPFGSFSVCADDSTVTPAPSTPHFYKTTVSNSNPAGTSTISLPIPSTTSFSGQGVCT